MLKSRIQKLEGLLGGGRIFTPEQMDGLMLYGMIHFGVVKMSKAERKPLESSAAYQWGKEWWARRLAQNAKSLLEVSHFANPEETFLGHTEQWWDSGIRLFLVKAWERQLPDVRCPFQEIAAG